MLGKFGVSNHAEEVVDGAVFVRAFDAEFGSIIKLIDHFMDKKLSWILLVAVIVVALISLALYLKGPGTWGSNMAEEAITFTSPETGEAVRVEFKGDDHAVLNGLGYDGLAFDLAIAASGARYVNDDLGLELWNRGEAVTISKDGRQIFSGNVGGLTDALKLAGTWVWQATTIGEVVTEPRRTDAFTITFDADESRVNGTTDCNGFFGGYEVNDHALAFGPLASTMMYCEGSQEHEFTSALEGVKSFFFAGSGALVLELEDDGTMLFGRQ